MRECPAIASPESIKRGQTAGYVVQVYTKNGTASDVSDRADRTAVQPEAHASAAGAPRTNGTASCSLSSVTTKATSLERADHAVASNATSVSLGEAEGRYGQRGHHHEVDPAAAAGQRRPPSPRPHGRGQGPSSAAAAFAEAPREHIAALPLGPIPALNGQASVFISGPATRLTCSRPSARRPARAPGPHRHRRRRDADQEEHRAEGLRGPRRSRSARRSSPAQVAGLIALGLAIMLTVTRLSRCAGGPSHAPGA